MINTMFLVIGIIIGCFIMHYKNQKESKMVLDIKNNLEDRFIELIPFDYEYVEATNNVGFEHIIELKIGKDTLDYLDQQKPPLKQTLKEELQEAINKEDYLLAKEIHNKLKLL